MMSVFACPVAQKVYLILSFVNCFPYTITFWLNTYTSCLAFKFFPGAISWSSNIVQIVLCYMCINSSAILIVYIRQVTTRESLFSVYMCSAGRNSRLI